MIILLFMLSQYIIVLNYIKKILEKIIKKYKK